MRRNKFLMAFIGLALLASACNKAQESQPKTGNQDSTSMDALLQTGPMPSRPIIYQMLVRLFGNKASNNKAYGTIEENGVGRMNDVNDEALTELAKLGITHIWYTGLVEHATMTAFEGIPADDADVVKGRAGSPYAIKDYYDIAPALASEPGKRMQEFEALVKRSHDHHLKVIIDFVPNHVARSYHSDQKPAGVADLGENDDTKAEFNTENNFYYLPHKKFKVPEYNPLGDEKAPGEDGKFDEKPAKATGNNVFNNQPRVDDWFETAKLNYGVEFTEAGEQKHFDPIPSTWKKMRDILLFWASKGVDGFRCDIAEMVPVEFWEWAIKEVKQKHPEIIFIAEIYNPGLYVPFIQKGGFDYLYDKVGVYDKVRALMEGKEEAVAMDVRVGLDQSKGIDEKMLRFLENHDEQRIASPQFAGDARAGIPGMTVTALLGKGPVMIYFGQESGEPGQGAEGFQGDDGRSTIFDYWGVPKHQNWMNNGKFDGGQLDDAQISLRKFYKVLLEICNYHEAAYNGITLHLDSGMPKVVSFIRKGEKKQLLIVANFEKTKEMQLKLKIPAITWQEMKLEQKGGFVLADLLEGETSLHFDAEKSSTEGIAMQLPPWSAFVFEMEPGRP